MRTCPSTAAESPRVVDPWAQVAPTYDDLYATRWSVHEDESLKHLLQSSLPEYGRVLDIGCGTGLVGRLLGGRHLVGCDRSPAMIRRATSGSYVDRRLIADAGQLPFADASFTAVLATNAVASYAPSLGDFFREACRVLLPHGLLLCSVLGRFAPRRMVRLKVRETEHFVTRGLPKAQQTGVLVHTYTRNYVAAEARRSGLDVAAIVGTNLLAGLFESPRLHRIDSRAARWLPTFSHQLYLTAHKGR